MADLSRRQLLGNGVRGLAALGLGGLVLRGAHLAGGGGQPAAAQGRVLDRDLRVGYLPITDASALLAAHEGGHWRAAGLPSARPTLFRSWEALAQAFVVGEVDAVHLLMPLAVQLRFATSAPIKVIGWGHTNGSALTVAPPITATEQLAGTRIALPSWWSIHSILTQRLLAEAGLRPVIRQAPSAAAGTVELTVMPPAEMVSALAAGAISAFTVADPFSAVAEAKKVGRVHRFLGDVWRDHACCAIAVREDLIERHPQAVDALADGLLAAQRWLDGNRADAGALLTSAGYLPQPAPAVAKVFQRPGEAYAGITRHADWHGEKLGFNPWPQASYTAELVTAMQRTAIDGATDFLGALQPAQVHRDLVDDRFIAAALRRAGQPIPPQRQEVLQ